MGAGRRTQTVNVHDNTAWSTTPNNGLFTRKLHMGDMCAVIFGCTHNTMAECLSKQIFGLLLQITNVLLSLLFSDCNFLLLGMAILVYLRLMD